MSGALIVVGLVLLGFLVWGMLSGHLSTLPEHRAGLRPVHPLVGVVFTLLLTVAAVRISRIGVYHGESGVRSRSFLRTRTVPWVSVEKFEDRPAAGNPWIPGLDLPARAIWIVRRDGVTIQTPLVYLVAQIMPDSSGRTAGPRHRWIWSERECRTALAQLNRALARARHDLDLPA